MRSRKRSLIIGTLGAAAGVTVRGITIASVATPRRTTRSRAATPAPTRKGSWVNVVGAHSYPCLELPQNWAPLALDGAQGSNAKFQWVSLTSTGTVRAASDAGVTTYAGTGYTYITIPWVPT